MIEILKNFVVLVLYTTPLLCAAIWWGKALLDESMRETVKRTVVMIVLILFEISVAAYFSGGC